jgi:2-keto-4-pentenoate hydratase/2-oxohepta-3-ene-1,7-dioic acid hydratase in catechol pathway
MFDCLTFEQHLLGGARASRAAAGDNTESLAVIPEVYREIPVYYKCNRFSVIGTDTDIVRPRYSQRLDYELEFGVFLSRTCKNISPQQAEDCIFGYCIFNDASARDQQVREMRGMLGPSKSKDFDTGNVMGPWLVTADEVSSPGQLTMSAYINGERVSSGSSAGMMHTFPEIIAYSSQDETRRAGEFFGSGTVGGGCGLETGRWLQHGDVLELEVTGLGRLRNRIVFQNE